MIEPRRARRLTAFRVAAIYLLAGTTWIIVTDLLALDRPSVAVSAFLLSISKGLFFVLASAVLIYVLTAQMTRELAKSESDLALLIREASDPIFVLGPDGRLYDVNRRGLEVLGMSAEEAARLRVEDVITPESLQEQPLAWDRLRAGETVRSVRGIRLASGATIRVELSARMLPDGRVLGIARDLSERSALEEQLRQAQKMEAVGSLTGGIAHDLNNMLTAVLGSAELLRQDLPADRPELHQELAELTAAAGRSAAMVKKLLSFARRAPVALEPVDVGDTIADLLGTLQRLLPPALHLELEREAGPLVALSNASALEQVVLNLVTNARDAMPQGGRVAIRLRAEAVAVPPPGFGAAPGSYAILEVQDEGVGMDPATLERVFEPFFTTKATGRGSGLGLAVAYGLVRQHRGFIAISSARGKGTTVRVGLPLRNDLEPREPQPDERALPRGHETILLVDDEPAVRALASRSLRRLGYTVIEAPDGVEGVVRWREHGGEVGLVLTDIVMPRMDGRQLAAAIRSEAPEMPVVLMTGYDPEALPASPDGHPILLKPWTPVALAEAVRDALDGKSQAGRVASPAR